MLRHEIALNPETWTPAATLLDDLDSAWPEDAHQQTIPHPLGHVGRFRLAVNGNTLELAADITEPTGWSFSPRQEHEEWYNHDHVVMFLDPAHDHMTRRMLAVMRDGQAHIEDTWHLCGEEVSDIQLASLKLPPMKFETATANTPNGWRLRVRMALDSLGSRYPEAPIGLMIKLGIAGPVMHEAPTWPARHPFWKDCPFANGDVTAHAPALVISIVDFGKPVWKVGKRSSSIKLEGRILAPNIEGGTCEVSITDTMGNPVVSNHPWTARGQSFRLTVPVDYPFTSKWAPEILSIARVSLTVKDSKGAQLWTASYPFGFDAGIIVREPFDLNMKTPRPQPSDPAFVEHFRAWLFSKLPDFSWRTTRSGAPSDFFLKAPDPADNLNLMSPTIYADMAALLCRKFGDWQDALCAVAMFLHHPCMTVHSSSWAKITNNANTDTVLRMGGCFCSDTARVAARLAEELGKLYRVPLKGFSLGLRGHLTGLVETPIGEVLVDPMLGLYYHSLDNTRLATLDEMREDIRIQQRMWLRAFNHGHEFFYKMWNQTKSPWVDGPTVFPPA